MSNGELQELLARLSTSAAYLTTVIKSGYEHRAIKNTLDEWVPKYSQVESELGNRFPNELPRLRLSNPQMFAQIDKAIALHRSLSLDSSAVHTRYSQTGVNDLIVEIHAGRWPHSFDDQLFKTLYLHNIDDDTELPEIKHALNDIKTYLNRSEGGKKILRSLQTARAERTGQKILIGETYTRPLNDAQLSVSGTNKGWGHWDDRGVRLSDKTLMVVELSNPALTGHLNHRRWLIYVLSNELFEAVWGARFDLEAVGSFEFQALTKAMSTKLLKTYFDQSSSLREIRQEYKQAASYYKRAMPTLLPNGEARSTDVLAIADMIVEYLTEHLSQGERYTTFQAFLRDVERE